MVSMPTPSVIRWVAPALFAAAILHTFSTKFFERRAHARPAHAGIWHLLGEVEVVFGFWAIVLAVAMFAVDGAAATTRYFDSRDLSEPMFVFAIMVIAATRPILQTAVTVVRLIARALPLPGSLGFYVAAMIACPLLGSFLTEPAAMTLAALMLSGRIFSRGISDRLKYASLGVLFVNVSIGGTLTPFAAPPVLMVAGKWGWDLSFMLTAFGAKAVAAVMVNSLGVALVFSKELARLPTTATDPDAVPAPRALVAVHLALLAGVVVFARHPVIFMGIFLLFLAVAHAYERHQDRLILREGLLVAIFLAGLVMLGGQQEWWLRPALASMTSSAVFFGAAALTAITDNASLTYLGSLVHGLSAEFKYALVAGAVSGGGLTIIANAPNPAGIAILRGHFKDETVNPVGLLLAALPPTVVAMMAFRYL